MSETCRDGVPLRRSELKAALEVAQRILALPKGGEALRVPAAVRLTWSEGGGESAAGRSLDGRLIAGRKLRGTASLEQRRAGAACCNGVAAVAAACSFTAYKGRFDERVTAL